MIQLSHEDPMPPHPTTRPALGGDNKFWLVDGLLQHKGESCVCGGGGGPSWRFLDVQSAIAYLELRINKNLVFGRRTFAVNSVLEEA